MAVALQHQLTAAGIGGLLKPAPGVGVAGAMSGLNSAQSSAAALQLAGDGDANTSTLTLLDPPGALLHPALRNVKAINIGALPLLVDIACIVLKPLLISFQVVAWAVSDRCWAFRDPA